MSYYDNRDAKVKIAMELESKGWKIFGFREDQSDMMTDYYSPAYWNGLATKNGYVLVIDNHSNSSSGYEVKKNNYNKTTYKASDRITKLEAMMNDAASTENEKASCAVLIEKEKEKQGIAPTYTVTEIYPTFAHGNPKAANWHIEKDGQILAKGNGAFAVNNYDWENKEVSEAEQKAEKLKKFINKIEKVLTDSDALKAEVVKVPKQVIKPVQKDNNDINVGDILSFSYHGHFWIVTNVHNDSNNKTRVTYELVGSEKRGYSRINAAKRYFQYLSRLEQEMNEAKVKVYTLQEVTEYVEKTVFKKTKRTVKASDAVQIESNEVTTEQPAEQPEQVTEATQTETDSNITTEDQATKRQLWALHCATKLNTTNLIVSKEKASELINKSKAGNSIIDDVKAILNGETVGESHSEQNEPEVTEDVAEANGQAETAQEPITEVEGDHYTFKIDLLYKYHDVHFKAWNYSVVDITELLNITNINYYESGEKFICTGLTLEQVSQIEMINKDNGVIIFYDDKYNELSHNSEVTEEPENTHNSDTANEPTEQREAVKAEPVIINGKITIKEITFVWSESRLISDDLTFSTFAEAEKLIKQAANDVNGGYDKTKFIITWTDGNTYEGRIDIEKDYAEMKTPIKDHITDWLLFLTGDNKPAHMTDRSYAEHLTMYNISDKEKQEYYDFMEQYALTDIEPTESQDNVIYHNFNNSDNITKQEEGEIMTATFEDIFSKFDNIEITTESKVNADDLEFCQEQEGIYRQTVNAYNSLNEQLQALKPISEAHGNKYMVDGLNGTKYARGTSLTAGFSVWDLEKNIENIKGRFIQCICKWFEQKYNITIDEQKIQKKYKSDVTYENIIEEITEMLGGYNFNEKAEQEIKQNLRKSVAYEKVSPKGNKLTLNAFLYIDTSWKQWGTEKIHYNSGNKLEQLINALYHFETGKTVITNELQVMSNKIQHGKNEEVFGTHELNYSKVKGFTIYKNGKLVIEFASNQQATRFNSEYCASNVA